MCYKRVLSSRFRGTAGDVRWYAIIKEGDSPRLGMATSRRFLNTAVKRNRVKRLIRESFRLRKHLIENKDVVIVVRRSVEDEQQLRSDLNKIWHRVSEIK